MFTRRSRSQPVTVAGEVYGVGLVLEAGDEKALGLMLELLPGAWRERPAQEELRVFRLEGDSGDGYRLEVSGTEIAAGPQADVIEVLDRSVRNHIARSAPDHVFVHAGAVTYRGRGIVIPGSSFSGKTSLVAALVDAGATYYSDEYAVLDSDGLLHPFAKPLAIRMTEGSVRQTHRNVSELGGTSGSEPTAVGIAVFTQFRAGAVWQPEELSPATAVIELLGHTFSGRDRPEHSLAVLRLALAGAKGLKGDRGEADATAAALLARLEEE